MAINTIFRAFYPPHPLESEIVFPIPPIFKHPSGKTMEIRESEKGSLRIINGKQLEAKRRIRDTAWNWRITVIDYKTE
ncbi:MAG: hypothetical protein QXO71_10390 [Candidatus Jordarchaeaceae archaeon]